MWLAKDAATTPYFSFPEVFLEGEASAEEELPALGASDLLSADPALPSDDEEVEPFPLEAPEPEDFLA